jgi:hypothetical protein
MVTNTGADVDLRSPVPSTISAHDIGNALAKINRFNGHTSRPYSVAEHSLLVLQLLQREYGITSPAAQLAALLHDAHEAYTGDLSTPCKRAVGYQWTDFEDRWERLVLNRFGVFKAAREYASLIKSCDLMALACERTALLPPAGVGNKPWPMLDLVHQPAWVDLSAGHHATYTWADWRDVFLEQFAELFYAVHGDTQPNTTVTL